jgi:hypothetical protein
MLKTIELRFTPSAQLTTDDADSSRPLLRLMLNHEEL